MNTISTENSQKRADYASKDATYIRVAEAVAERSKDPNTQVGACFVSTDDKIISTGYNGTPRGFDDDNFNWGKNPDEINKYHLAIHAEANAILRYNGLLRDFEGATAYVTHFVCNSCILQLATVGVTRIVYRTAHSMPNPVANQITEMVAKNAGITITQFDPQAV